jgi:CheY-like chemotaxis protein
MEVEEAKVRELAKLVGGAETILVAEDDPDVRRVTQIVLREFGYRVIEAVDGNSAIEKFIENRDDIELLLLDVIMPKKNGKKVYEEIRKMRPDIKCFFISGYTADVMQQKGITEQGFYFVSKPISPETLLRKVREVLDK